MLPLYVRTQAENIIPCNTEQSRALLKYLLKTGPLLLTDQRLLAVGLKTAQCFICLRIYSDQCSLLHEVL